MRRSFHPARWWKIILVGLAGAALVSGSLWASRGSPQAAHGPLDDKFWPSEFGRTTSAGPRIGSRPQRSRARHAS